jgi:predicted metal-dependent enzyme (double-stranded beta helix superfamily)
VSTSALAKWSPELRSELDALTANPRVGTRLLLQDEHTRIWEIRLAPGERLPFHRHVLDYVWVCVTGGTARSHDGDGVIHEIHYRVGETSRLSFGGEESMIHDLENTGREDLVFTTFEYLASANDPLPLGDDPAAR